MLKMGGRCAVIVPDGVLFGNSGAHKALKQMLVEDNQLEAVVSLPAGVFKPYASVSTAILIFAKGGKTNDVFYYDVQADGFTLDDKRNRVGDENDFQDIDDARKQWHKWNHSKDRKEFEDRKRKAFYVPVQMIRDNGYDLSVGRYKEHVYEEMQYDHPREVLKRLSSLENEIQSGIKDLEGMLG